MKASFESSNFTFVSLKIIKEFTGVFFFKSKLDYSDEHLIIQIGWLQYRTF